MKLLGTTPTISPCDTTAAQLYMAFPAATGQSYDRRHGCFGRILDYAPQLPVGCAQQLGLQKQIAAGVGRHAQLGEYDYARLAFGRLAHEFYYGVDVNLQSATRTDGIAAATLMYPCSFIFYSLTYARTICST